MNVLGHSDHIGNFLQKSFNSKGVLVLAPTIKDKTNSLETLYPFFVLCGLVCEITARKTNFL